MRLIAFALTVIMTFASFSGRAADSVKVYFRVGHRHFDPSLGENRKVMDSFVEKVRKAVAAGEIDHIVVSGCASPDGLTKANELLARNRCATIADYMTAKAGVCPEFIEQNPAGVGWDELRRLVAENFEVPSREKVLDILDNTPVWIFDSHGRIVDGRKKQLMNLHGGRPYSWMLVNIFPQVRNAVAIVLYLKGKDELQQTASEHAPGVIQADNTSTGNTVTDHTNANAATADGNSVSAPGEETADHTNAADVVIGDPNAGDSVAVSRDPATGEEAGVGYEEPHHRFALKSNLLLDCALMPNIEFEWLFDDNWSAAIEADVAWWKPADNKVYRLAVVSPEVRYHINPRAPWHGMYAGAFVGGGIYQLEKGGKGYRGEGGMAGVSFGYMWPITRTLSFDAEIGAGYMYTRYKEYESIQGHRPYMLTRSLNYFGPLKLKFSLAWRFNITAKTVKVDSSHL